MAESQLAEGVVRQSGSRAGRTTAQLTAALLAALALTGCIAVDEQPFDQDPEQVAACQSILEQSGGLALVGVEGSAILCGCIVRRVADKVPNAAERWQQLSDDIETKLANRGVLGIVIDSTWMTRRSGELSAIGVAYAEALPACRDELLQTWSEAAESK